VFIDRILWQYADCEGFSVLFKQGQGSLLRGIIDLDFDGHVNPSRYRSRGHGERIYIGVPG
jgi:hypothetical protein